MRNVPQIPQIPHIPQVSRVPRVLHLLGRLAGAVLTAACLAALYCVVLTRGGPL
ncbi:MULTISPECIES: hypothetical protein [Streptomyces]|uniref:Uncharacterized protein n=1 Tax=Streptomyces lycii TaxID=2654337 RepID=A0ABQ7FKQ6_9ACTN|nr:MULTISPECIES: hypothetical protein [Streptomyces]KAF4409188.1 hypothetical protein GCU69_10220 [Streptomyces lycii]